MVYVVIRDDAVTKYGSGYSYDVSEKKVIGVASSIDRAMSLIAGQGHNEKDVLNIQDFQVTDTSKLVRQVYVMPGKGKRHWFMVEEHELA